MRDAIAKPLYIMVERDAAYCQAFENHGKIAIIPRDQCGCFDPDHGPFHEESACDAEWYVYYDDPAWEHLLITKVKCIEPAVYWVTAGEHETDDAHGRTAIGHYCECHKPRISY